MATQIAKERDHVRELARRVAEKVASHGNTLVFRRWRDVNALRRPDRPPVWCRPVGVWSELLPEDALYCTDPWLRSVERELRMIIVKHDIGDDSPVKSYFPVPAVFSVDPPNVWGVEIGRHHPSEADGAWLFDPPLKTEADFDRLQLPRFTLDRARTQQALARAQDLLGDILPARLVCAPPINLILCTAAAELRGLTEMMMDMVVQPELIHRLMAHLRDGVLGALEQVQATGLLTPNNEEPMTCSDPVGPEPVDGGLTYKNLWIMANSQEFDRVSPAMWEEFLLTYQMPIIERFGLSAYGCCENLTQKIDGVLKIPNLRIFVCSAWSNLDRVIERVGDRQVIMWRQKASEVVFPDDTTSIRQHLEEGMRRLQGCHVQIVLRELQTLAGHPDRLHVWTHLAKEAAAKYG